MHSVTLRAHFDGQQILLSWKPFDVEPSSKPKVITSPTNEADDERESWLLLSRRRLEDAYAEDEPEYSLDLIKEANPEYERR